MGGNYPIDGPTTRVTFTLTFIPNEDKVILYGGHIATGSGKIRGRDTWVYDLSSNAWTQKSSTIKPSERSGHDMIYDSTSNKVVLFGGFNENNRLDDTWMYDVATNSWMEKRYELQRPLVGKTCYTIFLNKTEPCIECPYRVALETGEPQIQVLEYTSDNNHTECLEVSV